jgi:hypothetical protein
MVEERFDEYNPKDSKAERIIELNSLFEEMLNDASSLSKDLIEGIGAIGGSAAIIFTIVIIEIFILLANLWRGPLYIAAWAVAIIPLSIISTRMLLKYFELRGKYSRLYELNKEFKK